MKQTAYSFLIIAIITGCSSRSTKKNTDALHVSTDSLLGNWIITDIAVTGDNNQNTALMGSIVQSLKNTIELSTLNIRANGALDIDDGNPQLSTGKWSYVNDTFRLDGTVISRDDKGTPFIISKLRQDSLVIENSFDNKNKKLRVAYTLNKIYLPDSTLNIFDAANNSWRTKPLQPETGEAIRQRLKQMLQYYSAYFAVFQKNKVPYFNREKILIPLMFYNGGLGITPFEDAGNFPELFYNDEDAKKAHALLEKIFAGYKDYPDFGNEFVTEYVVALKQLSQRL